MQEATLAPAAPLAGDGRDPAAAAAEHRLEDQIDWYDGKSRHNQRWFKRLKILQIVLAAAIPVAAAASAPSELAAAAGGLIVVLEGLQQLQQYQQNWGAYRSTCERLKHEKFLYLAGAGPYAGASRPGALLAERVEGLVSQEHAAWVAQRSEPAKGAGATT
ncbi:MAG TPA: DUF4231 domain-containing protein [Conexibacter sp.]|nr:DUF4231 domain-containing protein [Conexibacter sp.]